MTHEATSETVFFYGLFMDPDVLRQKGADPKGFRLACVKGYGLRIGERATLEAAEGEQAFGSVMSLTVEELELLYSEKSVADYVPLNLTVTDAEGDRVEAVSYILPKDLVAGRNPDYARALLSVAEKIGLPNSHLNTIAEWL